MAKYNLVLTLTLPILLAGCQRQEQPPAMLSYSMEAGYIDPYPNTVLVFYTGSPARVTAYHAPDMQSLRGSPRLIAERVRMFVPHSEDLLESGIYRNVFFSRPHAGPGPGICVAQRYDVDFYGQAKSSTISQTTVYAVVGSVAPLSKPATDAYKARLEQACLSRTDLDAWFQAKPEQAYPAVRLADAIVASARKPGPIPFKLECEPTTRFKSPQCTANVRGDLAAVNSRRIVSVSECKKFNDLKCLTIDFEKDHAKYPIPEQTWSVDIYYDALNYHINNVLVTDNITIIG
ncbi:hypothetical protein [Novosphingobium capsulatum]|uniref:hypothetical protein n=1 Tax=Novosphingobium capsulatum TaxID=13688 RepID=UPI0012ECC59D|nr:hypothetical protein [Novosphingobium capsulatum]WQD95187.1 hypothetical protein U0041_19085 [Novosphingobium capsulatum]